MTISVVIPNYNGEKLLKNNLPRVWEALDSKDIELIVVDDGSQDRSLNVLESLQKDIAFKLVKNNKNIGFPSTVNKGVSEATGEIVILINTDVIPNNGFVAPLISHFRDDKVFAVGCLETSVENGKEILQGRGIGRWERGLLIHGAGSLDKTNTLWVSGGSGAFRKNLWDKLGGFDTLYNPFYWEDIDISYRALKAGYKIIFEKKSIVRHEHDDGAIKQKYSSQYVKKISYRNQFIFAWKNSDTKAFFISIAWLPYHLFKGDSSLRAGFFSALVFAPKIIKSRLKAARLFVKSDAEVILEN